MSKINVGDTVECVVDWLKEIDIHKGKRYLVLQVTGDGVVIRIAINDDLTRWVTTGAFKVVSNIDKPMAHMFTEESHEKF